MEQSTQDHASCNQQRRCVLRSVSGSCRFQFGTGKQQQEKIAGKRVNALLIDVEGFDFEVLEGGKSTFCNTEKVEFEYNNVDFEYKNGAQVRYYSLLSSAFRL